MDLETYITQNIVEGKPDFYVHCRITDTGIVSCSIHTNVDGETKQFRSVQNRIEPLVQE